MRREGFAAVFALLFLGACRTTPSAPSQLVLTVPTTTADQLATAAKACGIPQVEIEPARKRGRSRLLVQDDVRYQDFMCLLNSAQDLGVKRLQFEMR